VQTVTYKRSVREKRFTDKQGQYLAFIYDYTKINGRAPAEADMERSFRVCTRWCSRVRPRV
jgi:hypothetical protein